MLTKFTTLTVSSIGKWPSLAIFLIADSGRGPYAPQHSVGSKLLAKRGVCKSIPGLDAEISNFPQLSLDHIGYIMRVPLAEILALALYHDPCLVLGPGVSHQHPAAVSELLLLGRDHGSDRLDCFERGLG